MARLSLSIFVVLVLGLAGLALWLLVGRDLGEESAAAAFPERPAGESRALVDGFDAASQTQNDAACFEESAASSSDVPPAAVSASIEEERFEDRRVELRAKTLVELDGTKAQQASTEIELEWTVSGFGTREVLAHTSTRHGLPATLERSLDVSPWDSTAPHEEFALLVRASARGFRSSTGSAKLIALAVAEPVTRLLHEMGYESEELLSPDQDLEIFIKLEPGVELKGRILDTEARPVSSAFVFAWKDGVAQPLIGSSGQDGSYSVDLSEEGVYDVKSRKPGYGASETRRVEIDPARSPPLVDLIVVRGEVITGRLVDPDGQTIEGLSLRATHSKIVDFRRETFLRGETRGTSSLDIYRLERTGLCDAVEVTKTDGRFSFTGLEPGLFRITGGDLPALVEIATGTTDAVVVSRRHRLKVAVITASRQPARSCRVFLISADPLSSQGVRQQDAADGVAVFDVEPGLQYTVGVPPYPIRFGAFEIGTTPLVETQVVIPDAPFVSTLTLTLPRLEPTGTLHLELATDGIDTIELEIRSPTEQIKVEQVLLSRDARSREVRLPPGDYAIVETLDVTRGAFAGATQVRQQSMEAETWFVPVRERMVVRSSQTTTLSIDPLVGGKLRLALPRKKEPNEDSEERAPTIRSGADWSSLLRSGVSVSAKHSGGQLHDLTFWFENQSADAGSIETAFGCPTILPTGHYTLRIELPKELIQTSVTVDPRKIGTVSVDLNSPDR